MRHVFIVNPNAGSKQQEALIENIKNVFQEYDYFIEFTTKRNDACEIARRYAKSGVEMCIYACGGDGTLHEVVNGIVGYPNVKMGIIPIGTGNDFIKALAPYTIQDFLQIENYLHPCFNPCDVLKVEDEYSLNTVSIGFDVKVAAGVDVFRKLPFSNNSVPYILSLVKSFASKLGFDFNVVIDQTATGMNTYSFFVAGNGNYYGGGFHPCPNALLDDGYMDVCLIKKIKHIQIPALIGSYKKGTHEKYKRYVEMKQCKKVQIIAKDRIMVCLDGEIREYLNPVIEIKPSALTLCLPKIEK